jgi:hypothetical protein
MKRKVFYLTLFISSILIASCGPTYVVREKPEDVVYLRPAPPSDEYIWVSGDWLWTNGKYVWHEGHYEVRRPGYRRVEGHWINMGGGWRWVPGHWKSY